jgi:hypothetical protein
MTRTVDQARLWPMPGDEWDFDQWDKANKVVEVNELCVVIRYGLPYSMKTELPLSWHEFRKRTASASPVHLFEGE